MTIKFNEPAYNAFKTHFTLLNTGEVSWKDKLKLDIPFISTMASVAMFHAVVKEGDDYDKYERAALVSSGVLSLIPGVNLSVLLLQGLGTLVALAIDGVRKQMNSRSYRRISTHE